MMSRVALFLVLGTSLTLVSPAMAVDITISINGQSRTAASALTLTDTDVPSDAGFTINGGTPTITADDPDTDTDSIALQGLVVTAGGADVSGTIEYWATFNKKPDPSDAAPIAVTHTATGTLLKGGNASVGSWVRLTAYIAGDTVSGTYQKTVVCTPATCGTFNPGSTLKETYFTLPSPRIMKGKIEFFLKASAKLTLTAPQFIGTGAAAARPDKKTILNNYRENRAGVIIERSSNRRCHKHVDPDGDCDPKDLE